MAPSDHCVVVGPQSGPGDGHLHMECRFCAKLAQFLQCDPRPTVSSTKPGGETCTVQIFTSDIYIFSKWHCQLLFVTASCNTDDVILVVVSKCGNKYFSVTLQTS